MPARYWHPKSPTKLNKCSEFVSPACDPVATDGCHAVIPCSYCLIWQVYGDDPVFSVAEFSVDGWYGTIAGVTFRGFWERNYETGECEFIVTLEGLEVYRNDCYGGVTGRDASDSVETVIYPDFGTLTWTKYESRPLEYITDPDTFCRVHFCDDCECSCECLCVTITDGYTSEITLGEICDVSYPCDSPVWQGTVGDYDLSIALGRDEYGRCIITATVDGVEQAAVLAPGCGDLAATITLPDDTTIAVRCKKCSCEETVTPFYPCECRDDTGTAVYYGEVTASSGSPCELSPSGAAAIRPTNNKAWNDNDCTNTQQFTHILTADPPACTETDPDVLTKRVVFIQKLTTDTNSNRNDAILAQYDWYAAVYNVSDDTLLGVFYEYDICCHNETPENAATSHLAWIKFLNVILGPSGYTLVWYNVTTAGTYGDCGYPLPF